MATVRPLSPLETPYLAPRGDAPARVALGTMNFGKRTSPAESARIMDRAIERGVEAHRRGGVDDDVGLHQRGASGVVQAKPVAADIAGDHGDALVDHGVEAPLAAVTLA